MTKYQVINEDAYATFTNSSKSLFQLLEATFLPFPPKS